MTKYSARNLLLICILYAWAASASSEDCCSGQCHGDSSIESQMRLIPCSLSTTQDSRSFPPRRYNSDSKGKIPGLTIGVSSSFEHKAKLVYRVLNNVTTRSWEWGVQSEVILEMKYPELSVYSDTSSLPLLKSNGTRRSHPKRLLTFLDRILASRDNRTLPFVEGDDASGDPASLGVAVMVASTMTTGDTSRRYQKLVDNQVDWLLFHVPRTRDGTLSQRNNELQFWSDYVYMVPPFFAYHGATNSAIMMLKFAYDQVKSYRDILQDKNCNLKIWRHVVQGSAQDIGFWSTGNGWAAAGMMRIYATFYHLRDPSLTAQTYPWACDLAEWVLEIVNGAYEYQYQDTYLLPNYLATNNTSVNYPECSGTALIASAAYRLASLNKSYARRMPMDKINRARVAIFTRFINKHTGAVAPVVDPLQWDAPKALNGSEPALHFISPEGQGFVLLLHEAWKAYLSALNSQ